MDNINYDDRYMCENVYFVSPKKYEYIFDSILKSKYAYESKLIEDKEFKYKIYIPVYKEEEFRITFNNMYGDYTNNYFRRLNSISGRYGLLFTNINNINDLYDTHIFNICEFINLDMKGE